MKKCSNCKIDKELSEFYKDKNLSSGHTSQCKVCHSQYRANNRQRQKDYMAERRKSDNENLKRMKVKSWRGLDPRKKMLQQCKNRSQRKGLEFNLTIEDIIIPDVCPYLNIPFVIGTKDNYEHTHSLDRIDSSKGYIKGNVMVITKLANSMKNSASPEMLITFANNILKYFKDNDIVQPDMKISELEDKEPLG